MVSGGIPPRRDSHGVFPAVSGGVAQIQADRQGCGPEATEKAERDHYEALQSSFKILINSFYGYLGFQQGTFNDFNMAEAITSTGREILSEHGGFSGRKKGRR